MRGPAVVPSVKWSGSHLDSQSASAGMEVRGRRTSVLSRAQAPGRLRASVCTRAYCPSFRSTRTDVACFADGFAPSAYPQSDGAGTLGLGAPSS